MYKDATSLFLLSLSLFTTVYPIKMAQIFYEVIHYSEPICTVAKAGKALGKCCGIFEVLTVVTINTTLFGGVTLLNPADIYQTTRHYIPEEYTHYVIGVWVKFESSFPVSF
jgi:hypothetical protein